MTTTQHIKLLGTLSIEENGLPAAVMKYRKGCALLAYLIITQQTHDREAVADLLWDASSTTQSLGNLRKLLHQLRPLVPELHVTRKQLVYQKTPDTVVDLHKLTEALAERNMAHLEATLPLYTGDLLAGFYLEDAPRFNEWLIVAQEQLRQRVHEAYLQLCQFYADRQNWERLISSTQLWLELDVLIEEAHYWLIYSLQKMGRRQTALNRYQNYVQIMAAELELPPNPRLVSLYEEIRALQPSSPSTIEEERVGVEGRKQSRMYEWGEAPRADTFYGRQEELTQLTQWLITEQANLITILGMGGQGKTTLAATAARSLADQFDGVYWRSVINGPPLQLVLADFLDYLSQNQQLTHTDLSEQLAMTRQFLHNGRYLLILDNLETLLEEQDHGRFREGHDVYEQLLQLFGQGNHQSCLILTSRESPAILVQLEQQSHQIYQLSLGGLTLQASAHLLEEKQLTGTTEALTTLSERYSGNPLSLKLAAQTIQEFYFGGVEEFLTDETLIFDDIRAVLNQQIGRLSPLEMEILLWLAIIREATTPKELSALLRTPVHQRTLIEAMRRLRRRSLLERQTQGFVLQNVITEYLTVYLVSHAAEEIVVGRFNLLLSHALMIAKSQEHIRQSQERMILQPLAQQLHVEMSSDQAIAYRIRQLFDLLRQNDDARQSYAAGNLLNLLLYLKTDVRGYDLSQLSVWQANLQGQFLPAVDFSSSDLSHSLFTEVFDLIYTIAFHPSRRVMAVGAANGIIQLWDTQTRQQIGMLTSQIGAIWSIAFSPDGQRLVSGGVAGEIFVWDVNQQRVLDKLIGHEGSVHGLAFSPDGQLVASAGSDQSVRLWDMTTGQTKHILRGHQRNVQAVVFSADGRWLASGSRDHTVCLWSMADIVDVEHRSPHQILRGHDNWVYTLAFSPDGQTLASGSEDGNLLLWNVSTNVTAEDPSPRSILSLHTAGVQSLAYNPDGTILASGSNDCTVRLWDTTTDQSLQLLEGHTNWVRAVAFSPDGRILASGGWDTTVRLWHEGSANWRPLQTVEGYSSLIHGVTFSPDGQMLASAHTDGRVRLWSVLTKQLLQVLEGHTSWVLDVAFSPDGKQLASSSLDHTVRLWDTQTWEPRRILRGHQDFVQEVSFSPDGEVIASASLDGMIYLWDARTGRAIKQLEHHTHWVSSVAFSPNGRYLASGSTDGTAVLWHVKKEQVEHILTGHSSGVQNVAFSPDGTILATASLDHTVRLWDTATGEQAQVLEGHTNWAQRVSFSPDGALLASCSYDCTVRIWDAHSGELFRVLSPDKGSRIVFTAFSPDGQLLVSCSTEKINLWNPQTGDCLQTWHPLGPYEGMLIDGVTGVTEAQRSALKVLGAVEVTGG